ncbi:MAG: DUF2461 domain-containing protein [Chitinophagaceae bacterium]|nr:DUF2461 domain-containing protein [Chitinophagaceae bacterium]
MIQPATLKFLKDLKKNNSREWFEKNRKPYENAKLNFIEVTQEIIVQFGKIDPTISHLEAKKSVFRINRDVRFSKDKSPYKTNMGMFLSKSGKNATHAGYYFHLEPGDCFIGGGLYMPMADLLAKVRQEIDYNWNEFSKIISSKNFITHYNELNTSKEYTLTRPPKGYEADNPAIEFLKMKSWITGKKISEAELMDKKLIKNTVASFEALQPLIQFFNRAIDG